MTTNQKTLKVGQEVRYDYFIQKKGNLIKKFDKFCVKVEQKLALSYDQKVAEKIIAQAKIEFKDVIPRIPYFGGTINPFNEIVVLAAQMVAVHKAMKKDGKSAEETVLIFYDLLDEPFKKTPKFILWLGQKVVFSSFFIKFMQKVSNRMFKMEDPNGFDFRYYKDDGKENDWHFVAKRCGIVNFFKQEGCGDLAPYCNFVDTIQGKALNMGVHCKACLGAGDATCEEYMKQGRETVIPENIRALLEQRNTIVNTKHEVGFK